MQSGKIGGAEAAAPVSTLSQIAHRHTHALEHTQKRKQVSERVLTKWARWSVI